MCKIAVLMTVHNRKENTLNCLKYLFLAFVHSEVNINVYLTDDGCSDGTPEAVNELYPFVKVIKGTGDLFWNRGMYLAWESASADYDYDFYLWLNDDTVVYPNLFKCLLSASIQNENQAIIVGAVQSLDHSYLTYGGRVDGAIPKTEGFSVLVDYFNGNIVLVPKFVFHKIGNLNKFFRHSKGDFEYGLRAKKYGIKMLQVGEVLGECDWHETMDKWCDPSIPLKERWIYMHRPTGMPPREIFYMNYCYNGIFSAVVHFLLIYIRCLFPKIWVKLNKIYEIKK